MIIPSDNRCPQCNRETNYIKDGRVNFQEDSMVSKVYVIIHIPSRFCPKCKEYFISRRQQKVLNQLSSTLIEKKENDFLQIMQSEDFQNLEAQWNEAVSQLNPVESGAGYATKETVAIKKQSIRKIPIESKPAAPIVKKKEPGTLYTCDKCHQQAGLVYNVTVKDGDKTENRKYCIFCCDEVNSLSGSKKD